jgi:hypothetical protein
MESNDSFNWNTRIANSKFDRCETAMSTLTFSLRR